MEIVAIVVFGWPGAIIGSALIAAGIFLEKHRVSFFGALMSVGFCAYIALNPSPYRWLGLVALSCNFLSAIAVWRQAIAVATSLAMPFLILEVYLAYALLTE